MNHLTNAQLVERYNAATEALSGKTGTHFRDRGTALRRTQKVARADARRRDLGSRRRRVRRPAAPRHRGGRGDRAHAAAGPRGPRQRRRRGHTIIRVDRGTFERS
jgi:hypothetical protein